MLGILLILVFLVFLIFVYPPLLAKKKVETEKSPRYNAQMKKLWAIAQDSMKERKPLRAEKALLTILKFDEKNAAAYNRLGILYAKESKFDEAIECFEIAQSLDNNPSSLHNAGLIYLETGAFEKAAMAFEQALELEGGIPARFIALAKALEKLGRRKEAIDALESAYELEASTTTLRQILALYEASGDQEGIENTTLRINNQLAALERKKKSAPKRHIVRRTKTMKPPKTVSASVSRPSAIVSSSTAGMKPARSSRLVRPRK
ncbi:tetratricopeptide repeat protein [Candidatus Saccharibacteria bacterium]|nr:tetratricopeptide repeat protein [Candidatus Saccharibacteria bacterium]